MFTYGNSYIYVDRVMQAQLNKHKATCAKNRSKRKRKK